MSISSPPRHDASPDGDRSERDEERNGRSPSFLQRSIASTMAGFRLKDGTNRIRVLVICSLFVFSLFAARLIDLQAVRGEELATKAKDSRLQKELLPAQRGTIFDAAGSPLAQSVPARDITANPWQIPNAADYAARISPIIGVPVPTVLSRITQRVNANGSQVRFAYVARQVKLDAWNQIRQLKLPATYSEPSAVRSYPNDSLAANLLGYTNSEGQGVAGLESVLDKNLAGTPGEKVYEQSATGGEIPTGNENEVLPTAGADYRLTINRDLQYVAQQAVTQRVKEVNADSAVAVVIEVKTGRILALAQGPTGNPNSPTRKDSELHNLAVEQEFEPGSTAKVMTLAAAVNEGKVNPSTPFNIPNRLKRGGFEFKDDVNHFGYKMTTAGILAKSSNIGTIQIAERIGKQKLYDYLRLFGAGSSTGLHLPAENPGYLPPVDKWADTTFSNIAYGQAFSVNAIQAASIFATIANGGVRVAPQVIDAKINADGSVENAPAPSAVRAIDENTAKTVSQMMEEVVSKQGTAPQAAIPGYRVAGKTGTAQLINENGRGFGSRYVASFIGFAPAEAPQIAVAVITRNPKRTRFGGETSGPVFKTIMTAALQMMNIPPSGTPAAQFKLRAKGSSRGGPWNL